MPREISAGIIIYRRTKDGLKFLLLWRPRGYWGFAKGHLEKEEKGFAAALREVREETGLHSADLILFRDYFRAANKYIFFREKAKIFKIDIFYLAESKRAEIKVSEEHEGYGWFLYVDATKLLKFQDLKNILKKANNLITNKNKK